MLHFKRFFSAVLASLGLLAGFIAPSASAAAPATRSLAFPVAPHSNVTIEWWYLNAHVTTSSGRHLALVTSFFRFGNAQAAGSAAHKAEGSDAVQAHYLIIGVTDEDTKTHSAYSMADNNSLRLMQQLATLAVMQNPQNREAQALLGVTGSGRLPSPTTLVNGACTITGGEAPGSFRARYGEAGMVTALSSPPNTYTLRLRAPDGKLDLNMAFQASRRPMYVGGDGNTGVSRPQDMKYVSLTRCSVTGLIDGGSGPERVTEGQGWFDHQWGNTWTTQNVGWDWWGIQIRPRGTGGDILVFRQRRLSDGSILGPMATSEDAAGKTRVTRKIEFIPSGVWESPSTHLRYPLQWTIRFPDWHEEVDVHAAVPDQEMPVLANGGAIWEGTVAVRGTTTPAAGQTPPSASQGTAYMELVGYGSPAVKRQMQALPRR